MAEHKFSKVHIAVFILFFPLVLFAGCVNLSGLATLSYNGFAYDKEGNLYLGKSRRVEVIDTEGNVIRTFNAEGTISYNFTISNDEIIMVAGTTLYWMDLSGNILETEVHSERWQEFLPRGSENSFVDEDGTTYTMEYSGFLRTSIFRWDGGKKTEVFKMPLFDYISRLLTVVAVIDTLLLVGLTLGRENELGHMDDRLPSFLDPHKL
ncbi:MAG: hypothetical protein J1E06_07590 [Acutalibacter sp.]|nr:hypothetical protein [Acutalibacter sp.]